MVCYCSTSSLRKGQHPRTAGSAPRAPAQLCTMLWNQPRPRGWEPNNCDSVRCAAQVGVPALQHAHGGPPGGHPAHAHPQELRWVGWRADMGDGLVQLGSQWQQQRHWQSWRSVNRGDSSHFGAVLALACAALQRA